MRSQRGENPLYTKLLELAKQQDIVLSQTSTVRDESHVEPDSFQIQVNSMKDKLIQVHANNQRIISFKSALSTVSKAEREKQLLEQVRILCDQNFEKISAIRASLDEIVGVVKLQMEKNPNEPETYAKIYQKQFLTGQVEKAIKETKKVQQLIEKFSINTSLKRIKALAPGMSDEEAESLAKKKNGFQQVLVSKTLGKASLKLTQYVEDIVDKHHGIQQLEIKVQENLRLMSEISLLVEQQGQMIDQIANSISMGKNYIERTDMVLEKEKEIHKKARCKQCCIILVGLIVLAIVIVPIVITVVKRKQQGL